MDFDCRTFEYGDRTPSENFQLPCIYNSSMRGSDMYWKISFDGESLITEYGSLDGDPQISKRVVETNTSGRSLIEQAWLEAKQRYKKKVVRDGYRKLSVDGSDVKQDFKCMKGNKYRIGMRFTWPAYVQKKLDGIRMNCWLNGNPEINDVLCMKSNQGTDYTGRISHFITPLIEILIRLPPGSIIDCEIYRHGWEFEKIVSLVKTLDPSEEQLEEKKLLECWIFDVYYYDNDVGDPCIEDRCETLISVFERIRDESEELFKEVFSIVRILQTDVALSEDDMLALHKQYVEDGYEGAMIKKVSNGAKHGSKAYLSSIYKCGRTSNILKYKETDDFEVKIVDVVSAKGEDTGTAVFFVEDDEGRRFWVRPKGSRERRAKYLKERKSLIGLMLTITHIGFTKHGVPKNAVGKCVRDYE